MGAETLPLWLLFWIYSQMCENYFATKQFSKIWRISAGQRKQAFL